MRLNRGSTSPVIVALLAGILLALVSLVVVLTMGGGGRTDREGDDKDTVGPGKEVKMKEVVGPGEIVETKKLANPPKPPKRAVADPDRIKEMLQAGKTYEVVIKAGFDARVEDKDWSVRKVVNIGYAVEMSVHRKIESNDGKRIVELRHFDKLRNVKLLSEVENISIELGLPGMLVLGALESILPGTTEAVVMVKPLAESLLGAGTQAAINDESVKAFARVDTLQGKTVRIVYVDGTGVESIQPVDCALDASERDFVSNTAVLSDCYILPDLKIKPGQTWSVEGSQFAGFVDPSWRGVPEGEVIVVRESDGGDGEKTHARLQIQSGFVEINASDNATRRVGTFTPRGAMNYSLADGYVETAILSGKITIETVSKDHILFEASFKSQPTLKIDYSCKLLP